ncbi:MAG TPA: lysozyme inhibitor LprI family protein [Bradyrhizobium sp.]
MSTSHRLAALALAVACLAPVTANAMDDFVAAISSGPTLLGLCGDGDAPLRPAACKESGFDALPAQIDNAFAATLAKAPVNVRPLLKRDQVWFGEIVVNAAESMPQSDNADDREAFVASLRQRLATLEGIAAGFSRSGIVGQWVNAFGSVGVTPVDGGAYRIAIETHAVYGADDDRHRECQASALVRSEPGGWLSGTVLREHDKPAQTTGEATATADDAKPLKIKIRRHGETLRVVADGKESIDAALPGCKFTGQLTASYFAGGTADAAVAAADKADAGFVTPTFDCARPVTASDEEICADPELAENDQRLNRAWKALLPRLDPTTRRALLEDQRGYVGAQSNQYPLSLHPAQNKQSYFTHFTAYARYELNGLQRERIALLEGFDENRHGLAGVWLAHDAILKVTAEEDGSLTGEGWKWDRGDRKAGCDYQIEGKVINGVFRSDEKGKNPDTLERDHATLIVNRQDDVFASKRFRSNGMSDPNAEEPKCKRILSSTARLFPARPSPDIDNSIR